MASDGWLADLNTTVGGLARCAACVCHIAFGNVGAPGMARFVVWDGFWIGKVDWESATASPDWVKDKPASGSVKILQLCRAPE